MKYSPAEYALKFRERSAPFGAELDRSLLARAAASALHLRGWRDPDTQTTVAKWQSSRGGLVVDGKYDAHSANALAVDLGAPSPAPFCEPSRFGAELVASPSAASGLAAPPVPLGARPGFSGKALAVGLAQTAQALLMTKGWKDAATKAALRDWQAAHGGMHADGQYDAASAAALAEDLGGPSPSPFYTPGAGAAHPDLVAVVDAKSREQLQTIADRVSALAGPKPHALPPATATALTFGAGALVAGAAAFLLTRPPRGHVPPRR